MHIIPGDLWAGAESQLYYTIKEYTKTFTHDVKIILFNKGELYDRLNSLPVEVIVFDESQYNSFIIYKKLKKFVNRINPRIIHTHEYKSHILAIFANGVIKNKARIIRTLHGQTFVPFSLRYLKSKIILLIEHLLLKYKTDYIVAVSLAIEKILSSKYNRVNIRYIPNGIETCSKVKQSKSEIKKRFSIESNFTWIGTAVRLVPVKNLDMLIDAGKIMAESSKQSNFIITIFGSGPLSDQLRARINNFNLEKSIKLFPHYDDVISVFNALDIFVLTSTSEGIPMSLLESMSFGAIPVCTSVGGMQEVIQHNVNGFLVNSGDAKTLAKKLIDICENKNKYENISNNAKSRIENNYSVKNTVTSLNKVYEE